MIGNQAQRRALNLPANGEQLVAVVTTELREELKKTLPPPKGTALLDAIAILTASVLQRHFRSALSYPNCTLRLWGSLVFYEFGDSLGLLRLKLDFEAQWASAPGRAADSFTARLPGDLADYKESDLIELGQEARVESISLELGVGQGGAVTNLRDTVQAAHFRQQQIHATAGEMESAGRRDVNARRGHGIEAVGGSGAQMADSRAAVERDARSLVADLPTEVDLPAPAVDATVRHEDPFAGFVQNVQAGLDVGDGADSYAAQDVADLYLQPTEPEALADAAPPAPDPFASLPPPPPSVRRTK